MKSNIAQKYRQARLVPITLSTGDVIQVRPLKREDVFALGEIPAVMLSDDSVNELATADTKRQVEVVTESLPFFTRLLHHALTKCIVTPGFVVVVDRPANECTEDEIPLEYLADDDQAKILAGVMSASGMGNAAVTAARPFRGESATAGDTGPDGAAVGS